MTNTKLAFDAESECSGLGIEVITRAELPRHLRQFAILLGDVLKKSDERCASLADCIKKLHGLAVADEPASPRRRPYRRVAEPRIITAVKAEH